MIKAVLLDLDDTLLSCPTERFVAEYLRLMDGYFLERWTFASMSKLVLEGVRRITKAEARSGEETNSDVFADILERATGKSQVEIEEAFAEFHASVYPMLRACTSMIPEAPQLVEALRAQGYAVAIATNPIYAPEAILQRLAWAGLPDTPEAYALVTHSGNMHFAKPSPAYYAEIVARVGVEPDEAMMVGDSLKNDVLPARAVGLNAYLVRRNGESAAFEEQEASGTLRELYELVSRTDWLRSIMPRPLEAGMIEPELRGNIGALFGLLDRVQPHQWSQRPDPNEWSIQQVVGHLLESERLVQRPRLQRILAEENPFLVAPSPPTAPDDAAHENAGIQMARQFAVEREGTIQWLRALRPEDWSRSARHSVFGATTLLEMAHFTAQHDRLHSNQICHTLGQCEQR